MTKALSRLRIVRGAVLLLALGAMGQGAAQPPEGIAGMQATAERLYQSLSDGQRKDAGLPFNTPERVSEVFTPGKRPGIQLDALTPEQRAMAMALVTQFTSEYGRAKAEQVAGQDPGGKGLGRYYLCFFGTPGKDRNWAWRVAEHHLTLVHVEVEQGAAKTFGPILLGANPPTLWDDEEASIMELWAAMAPEDRSNAKLAKQATSSFMMKPGQGVRVGDLSAGARSKVEAVVEARLRFFSPEVVERVRGILAGQGGIDALRVAFFGEASKRCREGGKWDFKLGSDTFLCDYENSRGHIHMAMKGTAGK